MSMVGTTLKKHMTRKTKELDHEKLVTVFHGSSLGSSSGVTRDCDPGSSLRASC
jgi:hypothetical protein